MPIFEFNLLIKQHSVATRFLAETILFWYLCKEVFTIVVFVLYGIIFEKLDLS
jgi:hypothetical protein